MGLNNYVVLGKFSTQNMGWDITLKKGTYRKRKLYIFYFKFKLKYTIYL